MQTLRGSRIASGEEKRTRRPSKPFVISVVVHIVLAIGMAQMLISPSAMSRLFGRAQSKEVVAERIGFLRLPNQSGAPTEGKSGGDGRPVSENPPARLVAPDVVPTTIPDAPAAPSRAAQEGGSGPLVGGGGPTRGIRPTYSDPRVWQAPGDIVSAPKSAKERLDSAIVSIIAPFNDSLAVAAQGRKPGDWTFEKDGRKYGIDPQYIRLGKVSIPTAVLALLPINQQANPTVSERNKLQNQLHADIFWQAQRGMNDADFKKAVRSIRERKERERAAQKKAAQQEEPPAAPTGNDR
jgi:hypothetical protein